MMTFHTVVKDENIEYDDFCRQKRGIIMRDDDWAERAKGLLKAELKRSHSPYYFMLSLASNAKKRGDKAAALDWYKQAYDAAQPRPFPRPPRMRTRGLALLSGHLSFQARELLIRALDLFMNVRELFVDA